MSRDDSQTARINRIERLRKIEEEILALNREDCALAIGDLASDIRRARQLINHPRPGDVLYLDRNQERPVRVTRVDGTTVSWVPVTTEGGTTHQGNLHDERGGTPYYVTGE